MIRLVTYKYRLYPNKAQRELLSKHFGACRWIYNWGLEQKIKYYIENKKSLSRFEISRNLTELKKLEEYSWLRDVNAQSLGCSLINLDMAYTKFFRDKKGYPKFKSKRSKQSAQFPQYNRVDFNTNKLYIMKFSEGIKCKFSITFQGVIKTITISKTSTNKYYASINVQEDVPEVTKHKLDIHKAIGVDLGIKSLIVTSDGHKFDNPKYLQNSIGKIKKETYRLSRKKLGSNNYNTQKLKLAILHEKVANQRADFLHKLSRQLVNENQVTTYCLETLNIEQMVKNKILSRNISDSGWYMLTQFLSYKAEWVGKNILRIGQFQPSSKTCNNCGAINHSLQLSDRTWTCECGAILDRDINAAKNIRDFAFDNQNIIPLGRRKLTLGETSTIVESMNQEIT